MNLREWARASHKAIVKQSNELHQKHFSATDVEMILRQSITVLIESLQKGGDLQLADLGQIAVDLRKPTVIVSNLDGIPHDYRVKARRMVRFRASSRLLHVLNEEILDDQRRITPQPGP